MENAGGGARDRRLDFLLNWCGVFVACGVALALRAIRVDPASPWWTLFAIASSMVLSLWLAWQMARRDLVWIAGALLSILVAIWQSEVLAVYGWFVDAPYAPLDILPVFALALAAMAIISALIEHRRVLANPAGRAAATRGFHRFASWTAIGTMLLTGAIGLWLDVERWPVDRSAVLLVVAMLGTSVAAISCLWDPASRFFAMRMWWLGFVLASLILDAGEFSGDTFTVALTTALAAFALAAAVVWNRREVLVAFAARIRIPVRLMQRDTGDLAFSGEGHAWMVYAHALLSIAIAALALFVGIDVDREMERAIAASGVLCTSIAFALLAAGRARDGAQAAALALGVVFAVLFGWSQLPFDIEAPTLHRLVVAAVAMAAVLPVYAGIGKWTMFASGWPSAVGHVVPFVAAAACLVLFAVLANEVNLFLAYRIVPLRWPAMVAVLAALVMLSLAALAAAVLPGRDPFNFSLRGRTVYVYAAEILLALALLHVRVTMPWLFGGWFLRFWPLLIVAIAFVGVGFAELCRRRRLPVLSEPLENTGALLPILPSVGFWLLPNQVNYSLLLLSVSALYSVLCLLRKSFWFGILAALAANVSLWYWLYTMQGIGIWEHPQFWLIPPAVCVLLGAYLNRSRLSDEQMTATRYLSAVVIYASSTADVFINGVGEAPWLPAALAGLSLVGIFAGIVLRVRGFLFLGMCFLMVALFTVIWHAAVEQDRTWIWWVTGIVTGALIIAVFGLFEKKRDDMLRLIERVKAWEA